MNHYPAFFSKLIYLTNAADSWTRLRIAKPVGDGVVFESTSGGPVESNKLIVGCPGSGQHVEVSRSN
jgi:hypothetical protein